MNSVHLLTQEKYRVENRFKNQVGCTECTVLASPGAQAARLPPLLRTPRAPLPAVCAPAARAPYRAPAPVRVPTHAHPACCHAPACCRAPAPVPPHACPPASRALPARPAPARPAPSASTPSSTIQHFFVLQYDFQPTASNIFFFIHDKYFFFLYFQQYEKSLKITKIIFFLYSLIFK